MEKASVRIGISHEIRRLEALEAGAMRSKTIQQAMLIDNPEIRKTEAYGLFVKSIKIVEDDARLLKSQIYN